MKAVCALATVVLAVVALPPHYTGGARQATSAHVRPPLYPLPAAAREVCRSLARQILLCPSRLPRASRPFPSGRPRRLIVEHRRYRNAGTWETWLSFSYGAPWEPESGGDPRRAPWLHNRPCCFLHFELYRRVGAPLLPSHARPARLGGRTGFLARASGYGRVCAYRASPFWCNHERFLWRTPKGWMIASLHTFPPRRQALALLDQLVRELRPPTAKRRAVGVFAF